MPHAGLKFYPNEYFYFSGKKYSSVRFFTWINWKCFRRYFLTTLHPKFTKKDLKTKISRSKFFYSRGSLLFLNLEKLNGWKNRTSLVSAHTQRKCLDPFLFCFDQKTFLAVIIKKNPHLICWKYFLLCGKNTFLFFLLFRKWNRIFLFQNWRIFYYPKWQTNAHWSVDDT